jgi:hypothetical protein
MLPARYDIPWFAEQIVLILIMFPPALSEKPVFAQAIRTFSAFFVT